MIKNGIARFDIAQKIDKRNLIGLGARERAHDEVEISGGEARPTIRPDHRERILRKCGVYGKPKRWSVSLSMIVSALNLPIGMSDPSASLRVKFVEEAKQPDPFESGCCNLLFVSA